MSVPKQTRYVRRSSITKEQLIEFGMTEDGNPIYPMRKEIGAGPSDHTLTIVVTRERNTDELALKLPDGGTLFLNIAKIKDLQVFEKCIAAYETVY